MYPRKPAKFLLKKKKKKLCMMFGFAVEAFTRETPNFQKRCRPAQAKHVPNEKFISPE